MIRKLLFETRAGDKLLATLERTTGRGLQVRHGHIRLVPLWVLERHNPNKKTPWPSRQG